MRSSFKYVVNIIIVSLVAILIFQFYWLSKLYTNIEEQVTTEVIQSISAANEAELFIRMNELKKDKTDHRIVIQVDKELIEDEVDTIDQNAAASKMISFDNFAKSVGSSIHKYIDPIYPISLSSFDEILDSCLLAKDIKAQLCYTNVINLKNDSIIQTSTSQKEIVAFGKTQEYTYEFTDDGMYSYSVHLKSLTFTILFRMSGILICTLLIIIILSFAFYYLINTVLRQKTLEEMKDNFVNSMTHELKTPIAVAYSITDTLLNFKQGDDKEKRNKYLTICKEQLSGLSGLVEQILTISMELREGFVLNKSNIIVSDMIRNLTEYHRLKSKKTIDFEIEIDPLNLFIYADSVHFSNIISNLIDNAIKYSSDNVRVEIKVLKKDHFYTISVSDNGIGIPSDKQPYVFDKFYRVSDGNKYQVKGYGLGLFYVKTMVEKHGGTITVSDSLNNTGTTFTINIPILNDEQQN